MTLYSIHTRPEAGPDSIAVLPERFVWTAFVFTPLWALAKGAWAFLVVVVVLVASLVLAAPVIGADAAIGLYLVFALWSGFAAPQIAGRVLARRNWIAQGQLVAASEPEAERIWLETVYGSRP